MPIDLCSIGRRLREEREDRGLVVGDVADKLCIRRSLVEAIESGNWNGLPHPIYVKGYIKDYGSLLAISEEVSTCLAGTKEEPAECVNEAVPARATEETKVHVNTGITRARVRDLAYAVFILIIAVFSMEMVERQQSAKSRLDHAQYVAQNYGRYSASNSASSLMGAKRLTIMCHERTWIRVLIDGTETKDFMLNPQEVIMLNGREKFTLIIGNAGGVTLFLNGKDTGFTGMSGEVKGLTLS
jgi:transcriptional regulator with XRE-family HTH domain